MLNIRPSKFKHPTYDHLGEPEHPTCKTILFNRLTNVIIKTSDLQKLNLPPTQIEHPTIQELNISDLQKVYHIAISSWAIIKPCYFHSFHTILQQVRSGVQNKLNIGTNRKCVGWSGSQQCRSTVQAGREVSSADCRSTVDQKDEILLFFSLASQLETEFMKI